MSVMLLENKTFETCHQTLNTGGYLVNGSESCLYSFLDWGMYDDKETTKLQDLFNDLYSLNVKSWNIRYDEKGKTLSLDFNKGKTVNIYQLLKHLQCIHYQIEGEKLENTNAFNYLTEMIEAIIMRIIERIPEYNKADWS